VLRIHGLNPKLAMRDRHEFMVSIHHYQRALLMDKWGMNQVLENLETFAGDICQISVWRGNVIFKALSSVAKLRYFAAGAKAVDNRSQNQHANTRFT